MKTQNYWKNRARANKRRQVLVEEKGIKYLKRLLLKNRKDIKKQIEDFYEKYSETYAEQLSFAELKAYKKKLKDNAKRYPENKILFKRLKEDTPLYKIDRLRAFDTELQIQLAYITKQQQKGIYTTLEDVADVTNIQTVALMGDMGLTFKSLSNRILDDIINETWIGNKNWSQRIWADNNKVGKKVTDILQTGLPQGKSIQKMSFELANSVNNTFNNAFRLIRTESAHISSKVEIKAYKEAEKEGIATKYRYDAFLDDRTSEICEELNGQVFDIAEIEIGVNFPPAHVNCRSTTSLVL